MSNLKFIAPFAAAKAASRFAVTEARLCRLVFDIGSENVVKGTFKVKTGETLIFLLGDVYINYISSKVY